MDLLIILAYIAIALACTISGFSPLRLLRLFAANPFRSHNPKEDHTWIRNVLK
jgi:hypothetical protein